MTITSSASDPTNTSPIPVTITFDQPFSGLTLGDFAVGNGTAGNLAGSGAGIGATYTQVGTGGAHTCGLVSDGSLLCWGANFDGQTAMPALPVFYSAYTVDITPSVPGLVTVDLSANAAQNQAVNGNTAAAQFSIRYGHTVTFYGNGSDGGATSPQTQISAASTALTPNAFTRTGYSFSGWNTAPTAAAQPARR